MKQPTGAWRDTRGTLPRDHKAQQAAAEFVRALRQRVHAESQRAIQDYLRAMAVAPKRVA